MDYFSEIVSNRINVAERINKSFSSDLEKSIAQIGEIREWSGGKYRKVAEGKWEKVLISSSPTRVSHDTMKKTIKKQIEKEEERITFKKRSIRKRVKDKMNGSDKSFEELFRIEYDNDENVKNACKEIENRIADLQDEINEIDKVIKEEKESNKGKEKFVRGDFENTNKDDFKNIVGDVKKYGTRKEIFPTVTLNDYFLDTETTFNDYNPELTGVDVLNEWDRMQKSGKYDWHQSPKSSSEYLIDKDSGDIYRFSDHWDRVASCYWKLNDTERIEKEKWSKYVIGVSNIKDFTPKDTGIFVNPKYGEKYIKYIENVCKRIKKVAETKALSNGDRIYMGELLNNFSASANGISKKVVNQINKIQKQYNLI